MKLPRQDRRWLALTLAAHTVTGVAIAVPVDGWEASIDGGTTWVPSRDIGHNAPGWLVAGPDFPGPGDTAGAVTADFTLTASVEYWVRLRDSPETVSVKGGVIILQ